MLRGSVREFAEAKIAPLAAEIDKTDRFPVELCRRWVRSACTASRSRRNMAALAWAISPIVSRWRQVSRASASVGLSYGAHSNLCVNQIAATATIRKSANTCPT